MEDSSESMRSYSGQEENERILDVKYDKEKNIGLILYYRRIYLFNQNLIIL